MAGLFKPRIIICLNRGFMRIARITRIFFFAPVWFQASAENIMAPNPVEDKKYTASLWTMDDGPWTKNGLWTKKIWQTD
jgi:hypothetical protein